MKRTRVYVDTSVIGGCFDEEFARESRALVQAAKDGRLVLLLSDLLGDELQVAPPEVQALAGSLPRDAFEAVCNGPRRWRSASVGYGAACESAFAGAFEPRVSAGCVLERQLGTFRNEDVGIGAYCGRGVSQVAPTQLRQATRRSSTSGRCLPPCSNVTTSSRRAPGWPLTSVWGIAQGEPRGQRGLASKRGERLAGRRPK